MSSLSESAVPLEAVALEHLVYADHDYPWVRLSCSCGRWRRSVPVIAGSAAIESAAEAHRRDVFGLESA